MNFRKLAYLSEVTWTTVVRKLRPDPGQAESYVRRVHLRCPSEQVDHAVSRRPTTSDLPFAFCDVCGPVYLARHLLDQPGTDLRLVSAHLRRLSQAPKALADPVVNTLARAAAHASPDIRVAAAVGLSCHPYPLTIETLHNLMEDKMKRVREEAEDAYEALWAPLPPCLQCGTERHEADAVRLDEDLSYDHMPSFSKWPIFCSQRCAVQYAVDHVQEELDQDELHECVVAGEWVRGPMKDCRHCDAHEYVGREDDAPGPDFKNRKRRKRRKNPAPG